jgi:hypothetical protein
MPMIEKAKKQGKSGWGTSSKQPLQKSVIKSHQGGKNVEMLSALRAPPGNS